MSAVVTSAAPRQQVLQGWLPVAAGLVLMYAPTFYDLATFAWQQDDAAHGPVILAIVAWLFWRKRHDWVVPSGTTRTGAGLLLLAFGLTLYALGRSQHIASVEVLSLAPVIAGALVAMRGWDALRACGFALAFIAFLVPLPGFLVDAVSAPLKQLSSAAAVEALYDMGYPVARTGVILSVGPYQLLVADACSGLRSLFSLLAVGALYLHLTPGEGWRRSALVLAAMVPIAIAANIARVLTLALLTFHFGESAGQNFLHRFSGMVLFALALLGVVAFDALIRHAARWQSAR